MLFKTGFMTDTVKKQRFKKRYLFAMLIVGLLLLKLANYKPMSSNAGAGNIEAELVSRFPELQDNVRIETRTYSGMVKDEDDIVNHATVRVNVRMTNMYSEKIKSAVQSILSRDGSRWSVSVKYEQ